MKKLSLYVFLLLLFCNVGFAEEILLTCDVNSTSLKTMAREDQKKFLGKKISIPLESFNLTEDTKISQIINSFK